MKPWGCLGTALGTPDRLHGIPQSAANRSRKQPVWLRKRAIGEEPDRAIHWDAQVSRLGPLLGPRSVSAPSADPRLGEEGAPQINAPVRWTGPAQPPVITHTTAKSQTVVLHDWRGGGGLIDFVLRRRWQRDPQAELGPAVGGQARYTAIRQRLYRRRAAAMGEVSAGAGARKGAFSSRRRRRMVPVSLART
jgi:hypothetical protein